MPVAAEVIAFPDAEAAVIAFFNDEFSARAPYTDVRASTKVPRSRPPRFIRVIRTGGIRRDMITDAAQLTLEFWSEVEEEAIGMASVGRALIHAAAMAGRMLTVPVYEVTELSGPQNLPDPTTSQIRYSMTSVVELRGYTA